MNAKRTTRRPTVGARPMGARLAAACCGALVATGSSLAAPQAGAAPATPTKSATNTKESDATRTGDDLLIPIVRPGSPVRRVSGISAAGPLRAPFEVVDAGREDTGDLATSFRRLPLDLRLPTGFDRVYRVHGRDDLYMRANGALYAVFPKSEYRTTRRGEQPVTPTDVVYRIGLAPDGPLVAPPAPNAARIDRRIDARIAAAPATATDAARERRAEASADSTATLADEAPDREATSGRDSSANPAGNPWAHLALGPARVIRE